MHWIHLLPAPSFSDLAKEDVMRIAPVTAPFSPNVQALFDRLPASWSPPFELFTCALTATFKTSGRFKPT
jgi:hypothetical protein